MAITLRIAIFRSRRGNETNEQQQQKSQGIKIFCVSIEITNDRRMEKVRKKGLCGAYKTSKISCFRSSWTWQNDARARSQSTRNHVQFDCAHKPNRRLFFFSFRIWHSQRQTNETERQKSQYQYMVKGKEKKMQNGKLKEEKRKKNKTKSTETHRTIHRAVCPVGYCCTFFAYKFYTNFMCI